MNLDSMSYIEVFHFAYVLVFSGLYNKQHLWFGHKMYSFITFSNIIIFTPYVATEQWRGNMQCVRCFKLYKLAKFGS